MNPELPNKGIIVLRKPQSKNEFYGVSIIYIVKIRSPPYMEPDKWPHLN